MPVHSARLQWCRLPLLLRLLLRLLLLLLLLRRPLRCPLLPRYPGLRLLPRKSLVLSLIHRYHLLLTMLVACLPRVHNRPQVERMLLHRCHLDQMVILYRDRLYPLLLLLSLLCRSQASQSPSGNLSRLLLLCQWSRPVLRPRLARSPFLIASLRPHLHLFLRLHPKGPIVHQLITVRRLSQPQRLRSGRTCIPQSVMETTLSSRLHSSVKTRRGPLPIGTRMSSSVVTTALHHHPGRSSIPTGATA